MRLKRPNGSPDRTDCLHCDYTMNAAERENSKSVAKLRNESSSWAGRPEQSLLSHSSWRVTLDVTPRHGTAANIRATSRR